MADDFPKHVPLIHLNGTSFESLTDSLEKLYGSLQAARDRIRECRPNGRDYYPFPDAATRLEAASERVGGWERAIDKILAEIEEDVGHIWRRRDG